MGFTMPHYNLHPNKSFSFVCSLCLSITYIQTSHSPLCFTLPLYNLHPNQVILLCVFTLPLYNLHPNKSFSFVCSLCLSITSIQTSHSPNTSRVFIDDILIFNLISSYAGDLEIKVGFGPITAGITKIQV